MNYCFYYLILIILLLLLLLLLFYCYYYYCYCYYHLTHAPLLQCEVTYYTQKLAWLSHAQHPATVHMLAESVELTRYTGVERV